MDSISTSGCNMNRDFTLQKYTVLCESLINSNYVPITVQDYIQKSPSSAFVILRHDVDRKIDMAMNMARLEHSMGIKATYYFRMIPEVFKPEIIKQIENMGHEIGYHYEVLDKAKGNKELAIQLFEKELKKFREIVDIKTICMHGNPLACWSNRELWEEYDFRDFGIIGEPYLSIDYNKVLYLSDTGRTWKNSFSVKDIVNNPFSEVVNSTDDIIKLTEAKKYQQMCILAHPNRWSDDVVMWMIELLWQNIKNIGKVYIKSAYNRNHS